MFVRASKYREVVQEREAYKKALIHMNMRWDALVRRINEKGGEDFLRHAEIGNVRLERGDIKRLLQLCHPDRHDGRAMAVDMTQLLLKLQRDLDRQ